MLFRLFLTSILLTLPQWAHTAEYDQKQFQHFLDQVKQEAIAQGISEATINAAFKDTRFTPKAISLDKKQPFKTLTFKEYQQRAIPKSRIKRAKKEYQKHRALLEEIGRKYGVQPRFIVALWGVESDFGRNMGNFHIPSALATLAFEGRRAKFFKKELLAALSIIDRGHVQADDMKGSWAGAMGQTQFMPSSFLELAVDYNNDGRKDIWHSKEDAFASIANYLSKRGWDEDTTWGREITLPNDFSAQLIGRDTVKPINDWQKLGIRTKYGAPLPNRPELDASIIKPEEDKQLSYMIYHNYNTLLRWNRSLYFATAIGLLSDELR